MKQVSTKTFIKKIFQLIIVAGFFGMFFHPSAVYAQADSAVKEEVVTEEAEAAEEPELISPSILFTCIQKGNNTIDLKAALKGKINGQTIKLHLLKITFLQVIDDEEKNLGYVISNGSGIALLNIQADSLKPNAEGKYHFKAVFAGNKSMEPAEEEMIVKRARLEIIPVKEDSLLTVQIKLIDLATGEEKPVPETLVGIFVKRSYFPLKVGEGTTDENGEASIEIPNNLPGDSKGNLTFLAKLDENEDYGFMETSSVQAWGIPTSDKINKLPRGLWGTAPPIWMVITFSILMITVWGHYMVIIYELFRLRKEEPHIDETPVNTAV